MNWKRYDEVTADIKNIGIKKNALYGDDSLTAFGSVGILARIHDKISRIKNLIKNGKDNSLICAELKDIVNYAKYYIVLVGKNDRHIFKGKKKRNNVKNKKQVDESGKKSS